MARLLYVEDTAEQRMAYRRAFRAAGHEVTTCDDYWATRRVLVITGANYDLTISDVRYAGDDRFHRQGADDGRQGLGSLSLLADLKAMGATMPVVMLTTEPGTFDINKLPPECLRPIAVLSKKHNGPDVMAARIIDYIRMKPG